MNSTMLAVLNSLFHSRKFQAIAIGVTLAIIIPLVNKFAGLNLDPQAVTSMVIAAVLGPVGYAVSTGIEDGKKAQANAAVMQAAINSPNDTGEELAAIQGIGGFGSIGSILGGVGKDVGIQLLVSQLLGRIKGEKNQERAEDIAADVLKQILMQFGNSPRFRRKAGLDS
jgi:hypothetical protein